MKKTIAIVLGILLAASAFTQTVSNDFQTRTEIDLSLKPMKGLKLSLVPELRLDESFNVNKYLIEGKVSYEVVKGWELGGSYRLIINPRDENSTEYLNRFALSTQYSHRIQRWEPSLRIKYTNYTEDLSTGAFLRYRAKLNYNIKNCKITPITSIEAFQDLEYHQIYKLRYALGARYKLNKNSAIDLSYSLDYYMQDYRNKHILGIGYSYTF